MIVFNLRCEKQHRFEGWFASNDDFQRQQEQRILSCPLCGSTEIVRLPTAPYLRTGGSPQKAPQGAESEKQQYANVAAELLAKLVDRIIETTEDVGAAFPEEARKIHYHESPDRQIRGTASPKEVDALREEGIEVVAVPIPLHRMGKTH